ncbi:zinc ribbon domain-containing protein [Marinicrinis sediminis]|uniref:Zinc ribbon domain-containing protein n=1 Tax=Marinicrinis sediminis TaxID=1652465 RepID=A0ABW5RHA0_9BACL
MKKCHQCGESIENEHRFCAACGADLNLPNIDQETDTTYPRFVSHTEETAKVGGSRFIFKRRFKPMIWIPLAVLFLLAIVAVSGWFVGSHYTSASYAIDQLEQSIEQKDAEGVLKWLDNENSDFKIDESQVDSFIAVMNEHRSFMSKVFDQLRAQEAADSNTDSDQKLNVFGSEAEAISGDQAFSFLSLRQEGKKWFFFDRYVFDVQPFYLEVQTNFKGTKLYINDEKVATADRVDYQRRFGPYLPGEYKVKAVYEGEYGKLQEESEVDLFEQEQASMDLSLNGAYVMVFASDPDAQLVSNGTAGETIPASGLQIGPVPLDGSIQLKAVKTYPWGEVESPAWSIEDDQDIYLDLNPVTAQLQDEVQQTVNEFAVSWIEAYTQLDPQLLLHVDEERRAFHQDDMDDLLKQGLLITGTPKSAEYDVESLTFNQYEDNIETTIDVRVLYDMSVYYQNEEPELTEYEYMWRVYLDYEADSGKWVISGIENMYVFNPSQSKLVDLSSTI